MSPRTAGPAHHSSTLGLFVALALLAGSLVAGCSRQKANHAVSDTLTNGIRRSAIPQLEPWLEMWRAAIPDLEADSLRSGGVASALRSGYVMPLTEFELLAKEEPIAFEVLSVRSPGGRYRLVFDRYQSIREEDGEVEIGGEPDSAPILVDERLGHAHVFEFCGTPCGYDWGCWVDSVHFALGGWAQIGDQADSLRGVLGIYSLVDSTEAQYFTRAVSSVEYASYTSAWRGWVTDRYRAWKLGAAASGN